MMLIKTYIDKSQIHGMGVFAEEFISKGTKIWQLTSGLDLEWIHSEFICLPLSIQNYILHWGYKDPDTQMYRLSFDNDRFMNWSKEPNIVGTSLETFAIRDILAGEELTYPFEEDLFGSVA